MSVQYARVQTQSAWLNSKFGIELAQMWTGFTVEIIESIVGRNKKGQRKGQLKGQLVWNKVTVGGWSHRHGGVLYPGKIFNVLIVDPWKINPRTCEPEVLFDVDIVRESSGPVQPVVSAPKADKLLEEISALTLSLEEYKDQLTELQVEVLRKIITEKMREYRAL